MTKQEEIREKTKNYLVGCIHGATASYNDLSGYDKSTVDFQTDELLEEQSKLGVVMKADYTIEFTTSMPQGTKFPVIGRLVEE